MTFSGSQTTTGTFAYPSPTPYPSTTSNVAVTQTVTVGSAPNPFVGAVGTGDFHTVESDVSQLVTHTTTTDAWIVQSGSNVIEYGYKSVDDGGNSLSAQYPTPQILDELPETNGASWSNSAAVNYNERDADGTASTRTYSTNGTYNETTQIGATGLTTGLTENADGSGLINANGTYLSGNVQNVVISAPVSGQITVTANYVQPPTPSPAPSGQPSPTPVPTIAPRVYTAPAWYGTSAPVFYSQHTNVTAGVTYPASCSVPASYGTTGNKLVQTTTRLDTVLGFTDTQTQTTYTNAQYGPVCVVLSDEQDDYYDYQDDFADANGEHFHFPGTKLSTTAISQTLTLQSGAVVHSAIAPLSAARVASASAAIALHAQRSRLERERYIVHILTGGNVKGVR